MTSEPQRCAASVRMWPDQRSMDHHRTPCNLPIEGYGPCVVCDDLESFRAHYMDCPGCGRAPHHPYQPSEYRHVSTGGVNGTWQLGTAGLEQAIGHAATPVRETV